jgi:hypothetical protein
MVKDATTTNKKRGITRAILAIAKLSNACFVGGFSKYKYDIRKALNKKKIMTPI